MPRQLSDQEAAEENVLRHMIGDNDAADNEEAPLANEDDVEIPTDDNDEDDAGDDDTNAEIDDDAGDDEVVTPPVAAAPKPSNDPNDRFKFKEDREGNLVDKDGKIVFKKGKQREIFTRLKKAMFDEQAKVQSVTASFQETVAAAKQLLTRYNTLKAEKNVAEKLGLTAAEAQQAAEMMAQMKLDPKTGVRKILTMLHLNGTDLKDIGVTGPLDAKTVAAHVLELQKLQQPPAPTEEQKAKQEADAFLSRHPAARQHTSVIAQAKLRYPQMSLDEIWFQWVQYAQKQNATTPVARNGKQPSRPIPHNGSRKPAQTPRGKLSLKAVDPSQSFSAIGKQLLADIRAAERE